jgi:ATP-binding cassette subfamily F protein uup
MKSLRLSLGGAALFDGVDLSLKRKERACLVGANGAGKSTLLRILAGEIEADDGIVSRERGVNLAMVAQEPDPSGFASLLDFVEAVAPENAPPRHRAETELIALGLDPLRAPTGLSGGEIRRAALAAAFARDPDVLLLDEPTNHLDIPAILALEERLNAFRGGVLLISHDRRFLERVSTSTYWLRQRRVIKLDRGYAHFDAWADAVALEEERDSARLETQLKAEERWLARGVTARRSRNEGRRRKLMAMRQERRERSALSANARAQLTAGDAGESGRLVIEARGVSKSFPTDDGERAIVKNLDLRIMRGDRLGLIGPNGAGKTTLIALLLQRIAPDAGNVRIGAGVEIAFVDQNRAVLDPDASIWDTLCPLGGDSIVVRGQSRHVASYAADFLFTPAQLRQPTRALSGGERNRLALALALAKPANLLVLDEPTNDLDMDSLDALEEMLSGFDGTLIVVSHDRAFLDGVTTSVLGARDNGVWVETPGGYDDFVREHGGWESPGSSPAEARAAPTPHAFAPRAARKLSYKQTQRLAALEARVPALEQEIATLEQRLGDASFFVADKDAFAKAAARLDDARREKDQAETEWLELETLREALARDPD